MTDTEAKTKTGAVELREVHDADELRELRALLDRIWGVQAGRTLLEHSLLVAMLHAGNYVSGAFADGKLVGGCIGFFGEPLGEVLHSHIAGVAPEFAGAGIGRTIKEHQRQWAIDRGIRRIQWTFDPLIARNARFNLSVLGAEPSEYLVRFYGTMTDAINAGDESDRMLVTWRLDAAGEPGLDDAVARFEAAASSRLLVQTVDGYPVLDTDALDGDAVAVEIPGDIERIRVERPDLAHAWRTAARRALEPVLASGEWQSAGVTKPRERGEAAAYRFIRLARQAEAQGYRATAANASADARQGNEGEQHADRLD